MKTKTTALIVLMSASLAAAQPGGSGERIKYTGTVLDTAGNPIGGATVELFQTALMDMRSMEDTEAFKTVLTGPDGAYGIEAPAARSWVFASKPGMAPSWVYHWQVFGDVEDQLVLTMPVSISGEVVDDKDKPVAGALVWLRTGYAEESREGSRNAHYLPRMPHKDSFSAKTGADGRFEIQGCPTNAAFDLGLKAEGKTMRIVERQYVGPATMHWRPGQKEIKLVADPAGAVEGKVRSRQTGEGLGRAQIFLEPERRGGSMPDTPAPALSNPDGTFRVTEVAPGAYRAQARFGTNRLSDLVSEFVSLNVEAGRVTRDIEIDAVKPGFLEVAVKGKEGGAPQEGVTVSVTSKGFFAGHQTGTDGAALLALAPGNYRVVGYKNNTRVSGEAVDIESGVTNRAVLEIEPPARVTGVVLDPEGQPVPDLQLRVLPEYRVTLGVVKTDAQGTFSFPWQPQRSSGRDNVCCILARDLKRNLAAAIDLQEDTKTVELRLQPGVSVSGRVQDTSGAALPKAMVQLFFWVGNMGSQFDNKPIRVDRQGRFKVEGLPAGRRFSLSATAKGFGSQSQQLDFAEGDTNAVDLEPFVLNVADRKLAGQVVDAEDKPVAGAYVQVYGQGQPNASARTDDKGCFRFDEVCEGRVQLSASSQSSYGNTSAEAGDTNVILKLGVNSVSFQQTPPRPALKGKPLPDLASMGLAKNVVPEGKPVLLCLVDVEQRPCRRFLKLLIEQGDALRQKGLTVLALQSAVATPETLKEWKDTNAEMFPFGLVTEKSDKTKWATDAEFLPWLILTDKDQLVREEGFALEELEAKLGKTD